MADIEIRRATPFDAKAIHRLMNAEEVSYFYGTSPYSSLREWQVYLERCSENNCDIFVADSAGVARGLIVVSGRKEISCKHTAMLSLAVSPDVPRQGTGRALMTAAISYAFDWLNASRIELEVMHDNQKAINLYMSCGFEKEGLKRQALYRKGAYCDVLMMALLRSPVHQR